MGKFYNVQPVIDPAGVVIDSALSTSSENPVQNKVVTNALNTKQNSTLSSAITIAGESKTTVEDALNALNSSKLESSDLGSAATLDVPTSGNASTTEVVKGDDTRLTDARTPVSHNHTVSEISDFPASMPASDVSAWAKESTKPSYNYSEIGNTPTLGSAAALNVATSGNASTTEVVKGDDTRLTDARTPVSHSHTVSEISDFPASMPASDVSAWAKESTKPSYNYSEIGNAPAAYTSNPAMDGTASAGTSTSWAKGDHVHPSDTSKVNKSGDTMTGALTVQGAITSTSEITDGGNNVLSDKFDATSLTFPNERFTITASSWSNTATDGYYTYTLSTGTTKYNTYNDVYMKNVGSTDNAEATSAEKAAYSLLNKFSFAEGTGVNSFTLYAKTKPTTTFYVKLSGSYMAKNAASSSKALDITTGCKFSIKDYTKVGSTATTNTVVEFNGGANHELCFVNEVILINAANWSSTANASGYYTLTASTTHAVYTYKRPNIVCGGSTSSIDDRPSSPKSAAYNLVEYFNMSTSNSTTTITAYAKTKPTTSFYITFGGISIS